MSTDRQGEPDGPGLDFDEEPENQWLAEWNEPGARQSMSYAIRVGSLDGG